MRRYNSSYYNHASITLVRIITHPGMASAVFQALVMTAVRTLPIVGALSALPAWCRHPIITQYPKQRESKNAPLTESGVLDSQNIRVYSPNQKIFM